jgi:hypothetical protein
MLTETISILPPVFDPVVAFGIGGLAVLVAIIWIVLFSRHNSRRALILSAAVLTVMALSGVAAWSGILSQFDSFPPPMLIMIALVFVVSFAVGLSPFGRAAAAELSFAALIGLQGFRLPLELVMHHAGSVGIMPGQLSYSGYNFDIVTGVGALLIFTLLKTGQAVSRSILWIWNVWGSFCLVVIAIIAITTSPVLRLFGDEPRNLNTWVVYFPYVWLPVVLVSVAISSHVVITRKLMKGD